jgi:hypothetical protein
MMRLVSIGLVMSVVLVSACSGRTGSEAELTRALMEQPSPQPQSAQTPEDVDLLPRNIQIYQNPNGWFALALPKQYHYTETDQGLTFLSPDDGFGGQIEYFTEQDQNLDHSELETILKQEISEQFSEVSWQEDAQIQEDDSLRLDWVGIDSSGKQLDAVSFIEQHGDTLFVMHAHGINQPYQHYNNDARIIVGTYVVRTTEPSSQAQDS